MTEETKTATDSNSAVKRLVMPGSVLFLLSVFVGAFLFCTNINEPLLVGALLRTAGLYLALQSCCLFIVSEINKA